MNKQAVQQMMELVSQLVDITMKHKHMYINALTGVNQTIIDPGDLVSFIRLKIKFIKLKTKVKVQISQT